MTLCHMLSVREGLGKYIKKISIGAKVCKNGIKH